MTAPTDAQVAEIAGKLRKAEIAMLVSGVTGMTSVCDRLEEAGLFIHERCAVRLKGSSATFRTIPSTFTDLGLRVRAALLSQDPIHG
ncbi:MAG: hypothetical protein ACRYGI_11555 [Janthinobacterium lividum]